MPGNGRRDLTKEKFWRRMVRVQARSGLSIRAWCREHDLHELRFIGGAYAWPGAGEVGRYNQRSRPLRCAPGAFVPVRVSAQETTSAEGRIEIVLPDQPPVHVIGRVDRQALAEVPAVLARPWEWCRRGRPSLRLPAPVAGVGYALWLLALVILSPENTSPFIYFQF